MEINVCPLCEGKLLHTTIIASVLIDSHYCANCGYRREKVRKMPGMKNGQCVRARYRDIRV